jgi:hypothetical protein
MVANLKTQRKKMTLQDAYNVYIGLGLAPEKARLAAAQTAVETSYKNPVTGGYDPFTSPVFLRNNNVGGIMYIANPAIQKDSVAGDPFPPNESKTAKYAKFGSIESSFRDKLRIVRKALDKSTNPTEYARALKLQGYYTGNEANYAAGLRRFYDKIKTTGAKPLDEKKKSDVKKDGNNNIYIYI